jgi:hypothetical protein
MEDKKMMASWLRAGQHPGHRSSGASMGLVGACVTTPLFFTLHSVELSFFTLLHVDTEGISQAIFPICKISAQNLWPGEIDLDTSHLPFIYQCSIQLPIHPSHSYLNPNNLPLMHQNHNQYAYPFISPSIQHPNIYPSI